MSRRGLALIASVTLLSPAKASHARGSEPTFSVTAAQRLRDAGSEFRVLFALAIPFDQLWAPRALSGDDTGDPGGGPDVGDPRELELQVPRGAEAAPRLAPAPARSGTLVRPRQGRPLLRRSFARALVRAVLRAGGGDRIQRLDALASRANTSAWLPELRLSVGRSTDETLRLNPTIDDPYRYTQSGGSDLWGELRLTWKLRRLVFSPHELAVERIVDRRLSRREKLISRVLALLFEWHRARLRADDPALLPEERDAATLRRLETEMILDVLSEGWFGEEIGAGRHDAAAARVPDTGGRRSGEEGATSSEADEPAPEGSESAGSR